MTDHGMQTAFPNNRDLPKDLTFFTAMVWNEPTVTLLVEPGSHGEETAIELEERCQEAAALVPPSSALARTLEARADFLQEAQVKIRDDGGKLKPKRTLRVPRSHNVLTMNLNRISERLCLVVRP